MTTPSSSVPQGNRETFDTGPLSWVMGEIREALTRSKTSLFESLGQEADTRSTALRHAKSYLHQAHGALQMVDVDGVAIITETVEDLFDRIDSGQLELTEPIARAIEGAYYALLEYLDELLSGEPPQPVRLFPYYRPLLEVRGAERVHPADLFFPNLAIRPQLPPTQPSQDAPDYTTLRKRFERALLPFLKSTTRAAELASASGMRDIIGEVQREQTNQQSRGFWWVMQGFADVVASGQLSNELYIKQLFARINLQIRRLSEGSSSIAERLLRDALFFIARADNPSPQVQQIVRAYSLDGVVPADYEKKRYGQIDVDAVAAAKERLSYAKNTWDRITGGDTGATKAFESELQGLSDACAKLNTAPLTKLLGKLIVISRHASVNNPSPALGLEMATSLLFIENSLTHMGHLPDDFAERAEALSARLLAVISGQQPPGSAEWLDEMSRRAQQRQTMMVLATEMQSSLRQVEKVLEEYFREPAQGLVITQIDPILHQIEGALAILDQDDAVRAVRHTQAAVQRFAESTEVPDVKECEHVARNVGALSFFIETLQLQSEGVKKRFSFDDERGVFHANILEKNTQPHAPLEVEVTGFAVPEAKKQQAPKPATPVIDAEQASPIEEIPAIEEPAPIQMFEVPEADILPTVEDELALHQQQSAELAATLSAEPDNPVLQEQLIELLQQVRRDATLVDNPEAIDRAQAAIKILEQPDFATSQDTLADFVGEVPSAPAAPIDNSSSSTTSESDEEIDAELLEIFLTEAEEVLACVRDTVPQSRNEPYNQDHLTTLRRSFHTLKGSGRMVGLTVFGEAAWSVEQVLNLRLSETRAGDADLYALLEKSTEVLGAWVVDLQSAGRSDRTAAPLVNAAERIKAGGPFSYEEAPSAPVSAPSQPIAEAAAPEELDEAGTEALEAAVDVAEETPALEIDELSPMMEDFSLPVSGDELTEIAEVPTIEEPEILLTFPDMEISSPEFEAPATEGDEGIFDDVLASDSSLDLLEEIPTAVTGASFAEVIDFPSMGSPSPKQDDNVKQIGDLQISVPLHNIYLAETDELVRLLSQDVAEWRHESDRNVNVLLVHAAHSLAGSSATVGFAHLHEIAHALEAVLQHLARKPVKLSPEDYDVIEHSIERIRFMLQMFALGEMPDPERHQVEILERLLQDVDRRSDGRYVTSTPAEQAAVVAFNEMNAAQSASEAEIDFPLDGEGEAGLSSEIEPVDVFTPEAESTPEEVVELLPALESEPGNEFNVEADTPTEPAVAAQAEVIEDPLADMMAEFDPEPTPEPLPEPVLEIDATPEPEPEPELQPEPQSAPDAEYAAIEQPEAEKAPIAQEPAQLIEPILTARFPDASYAAHEEVPTDRTVVLKDDLDADLLPVFLEEGQDILPQIGEALRTWQQTPQAKLPQSLLRFLHTIKGSARMAGAMALGQHMHEMESRIEQVVRSGIASPQTIEDLLSRHDRGLQMFDQLLNPGAHIPVAPANTDEENAGQAAPDGSAPSDAQGMVVLPSIMPVSAGGFAAPAARPNLAAATAANVPLVRVRADILDRMVNQAGEVSISRSKLETEVGTLRQSLSELNENVARLRDQLREIEMQAESQITSRMAHSADREFDPLEFDRFTRLQELTRMMAESVNDVGSVQSNLSRTIDSATTDLTIQARLTRDLQQDLMRVRMVQFASISERLYRVTRQASKEVNKRVNLDIRGTSVEVDRGVLEKMVGPFEHLLRNAIVHGIESREKRTASGKNEVGELLVEIRQEGNEVVIHFSDDGQGLNLGRIRSKAESVGLLTHEAEVSDAEVIDMIFHSGFSTAEEVTELAGRGVGMDVVRSEAAALGGRISVVSEAGKGAHFTVHLPLTLAVTQVVVLSAGGKIYAVPSVLVEQVQQLKSGPLTAAYNDGAVIWQGQRVPMHYLSTLLGDPDVVPVVQQYSPIIILRSGKDRVAIHVDDIQGNREVVVKNIGPQLARMTGIAGATVMGSGDIVLILNPVPLAQRLQHENVRAPRLDTDETPSTMGAVAEMAPAEPTGPKAAPVQGLRTQHIIMVVDDSLTVRRVTQRLLAREGYQVVLAKDGVDALEHLQSITPDVMLVDIEMPRMDGFDLTRNVRSDERTRHIPIIMITSRTATKHRNYAFELGVNEYLGKPYQEDALLKSISSFLSKELPVS